MHGIFFVFISWTLGYLLLPSLALDPANPWRDDGIGMIEIGRFSFR